MNIVRVENKTFTRYFKALEVAAGATHSVIFINARNSDFRGKLPGDITARFYTSGGGYAAAYLGYIDSVCRLESGESDGSIKSFRTVTPDALMRTIGSDNLVTDVELNLMDIEVRGVNLSTVKTSDPYGLFKYNAKGGLVEQAASYFTGLRALAKDVATDIVSPNVHLKLRTATGGQLKDGAKRFSDLEMALKSIDTTELVKLRKAISSKKR